MEPWWWYVCVTISGVLITISLGATCRAVCKNNQRIKKRNIVYPTATPATNPHEVETHIVVIVWPP